MRVVFVVVLDSSKSAHSYQKRPPVKLDQVA